MSFQVEGIFFGSGEKIGLRQLKTLLQIGEASQPPAAAPAAAIDMAPGAIKTRRATRMSQFQTRSKRVSILPSSLGEENTLEYRVQPQARR